MDKMTSQYKKFLKNISEGLQSKEDFEFVKGEISKLFVLFFDEIDSMRELYEDKLEALLQRQTAFEEKIEVIEDSLKHIEKDIYVGEDGCVCNNFEIVCPYCEKEFILETEELNDEIECPECKNIIELDWNDEYGNCEDEGCSCCDSHCHNDEDEDM